MRNYREIKIGGLVLILMAVCLAMLSGQARATIPGVSGTSFSITAKDGYISTGDGDSVYMWGYTVGNGPMQYPGPTLILNQGDTVTITLTNQLPASAGAVSMLFPGQDVTVTGGSPGLLTGEAPTGGTVTYRFVALRPGTYTYYSGSRPELQVEMGLVGAIIVRPNLPGQAYNDVATAYDQEYLFLMTDMDPKIHKLVESGQIGAIDDTTRHPVLWFLNGRNLPDTLAPAFAGWLPTQPYNCAPATHPGETVLIRFIGGGRDLHPLHTHGNNFLLIARDGRLLRSTGSTSPDLAVSDFTQTSYPGQTADALWTWTGEKLGWDIYGHDGTEPGICASTDADGFDTATHEYCPDHGKPVPVNLPDQQELTFGPFFSGSPFLGTLGALPPGEGGFNPFAGLFYMWHSHNEKELTNNNIFIGGMGTMALVLPPGVPIP